MKTSKILGGLAYLAILGGCSETPGLTSTRKIKNQSLRELVQEKVDNDLTKNNYYHLLNVFEWAQNIDYGDGMRRAIERMNQIDPGNDWTIEKIKKFDAWLEENPNYKF